jgi:GntR family negative regulator for fad regulon and positive regulator of fabA
MRDLKPDKLLRPTQYVEKILVTAMLDGTYSCGTALPNERTLAERMGVTRPTLRETLK